MRRTILMGFGALLSLAGCHAPIDNSANQAMPNEVENAVAAPVEAYPDFTDAIKFAFSGEFQEKVSNSMAQNAPQVASSLGSAAFEFTCATMYETRGLAAPSDAASFDACGIIARISQNLPDAEKEHLFRAEAGDNLAVSKVWEGQAKFQGRTLPAIMLEAHFEVVNRAAGFKKEVCIREFYVDDQEFSVKRGSRYLSCGPEDPDQIKEAMTANEVLTPYQVGSVAGATSSGNSAGGKPEGQAPAPKQSTHEQAVADNKLSTQGIMAAWNAIDASKRAEILPQQRAWIKSKDARCSVEAGSASLDQEEQETARLKCDTAANRTRIDWLKRYLPSEGD